MSLVLLEKASREDVFFKKKKKKTTEGITGPWEIRESGLLEHGSLIAFSELLLFGLDLCTLPFL